MARCARGHHVKHWARGGETTLSNLVMLCRFHHRAVHEDGIKIKQSEGGSFQFVRQDGRVFDNDLDFLKRGERMDYGLVIEVLWQQAALARHVAAETPR